MYRPGILKNIFHKSRRTLAKKWFNIIKPYTIGITGSMGKTYTSNILSKLLPEAVVTNLNLDTTFNIPITALKLKPENKLAIFEMGIDRINEMSEHLEIIRPNIAIVTGITSVHTDKEHLGSFENLVLEKQKIVECLSEDDYAILNFDDENVRAMARATKAKVLFFGSDRKFCRIFFDSSKTEITLAGSHFEASLKNANRELPIKLDTKFIGSQFIYNLMASFLAYEIIKNKAGLAVEEIIDTFSEIISTIEPLKGRMSLEKAGTNTILNDSLRSNMISLIFGLKTFSEIKLFTKCRKILVLGEMGEIGETEKEKHAEAGRLIAGLTGLSGLAESGKPAEPGRLSGPADSDCKENPGLAGRSGGFDLFIGIGPLMQIAIESAILAGFPRENTFSADNALEAGKLLKEKLNETDIIYLKGSLLRHLERVTMILNNEKVECTAVSCPFYNSCRKCKYRMSGYPPNNKYPN
jgi:UDP-N-acetylmuramyl pentapeptide synthase